jgi:hypothetical protein
MTTDSTHRSCATTFGAILAKKGATDCILVIWHPRQVSTN